MKLNSYKKYLANRGSTLVLLVIIIGVVIVLGTSLMSVSMMHYRINKNNTEIKKSFYICEKGINQSFSNAYDLMVTAVGDSIDKYEQFILIYPLSTSEAASIFKDNFKIFVISEIEEKINKNDNPKIEITNMETLSFVDDILIITIKSKYVSSSYAESTIMADIKIAAPDYYFIDTTDLSALISLKNWRYSN